MRQLQQLIERLVSRINVGLKELEVDVQPYISATADFEKMLNYYASYVVTSKHPLMLRFINSNISGSYFLGKCKVNRSVVYKCDVRGDELKRKGEKGYCSKNLPLLEDEGISIHDSFLFKTLVHSKSHNLSCPENFFIRNTLASDFSNIHGATLDNCYLGAFSTVDHMSMHTCTVGEFAYVQTEELFHRPIKPGTIWISKEPFSFRYIYPEEILRKYVALDDFSRPYGKLIDFVDQRKGDFERLFELVNVAALKTPQSSVLNRFALIKGKTRIGENVLICQGAYLENATMGNGSNAQENTYIINSVLSGYNVTAHGAKIIHSNLGTKIFVAFNSFLNGKEDAPLTIGNNCIVMPHTIIDADEPITIPEGHLIWGYIGDSKDLATNTVALKDLKKIKGTLAIGDMRFEGEGKVFVKAFQDRFEHILELNGAYYDKGKYSGHAQSDQSASFNMIQPYRTGPKRGLYPTITIEP